MDRLSSPYLQADRLELAWLWRSMTRRRLLILGTTLTATGLATAAALLLPPVYTASTAFVVDAPAASLRGQGLGALAEQLGLNAGGEASRSPTFYAEIVTGRPILEALLLRSYASPDRTTGRLLDQLSPEGRTPRDSLADGVRRISRRIRAVSESRTGIVRVDVSLRNPELAAAVANDLIVLLADFDAAKRRTRAGMRREFVEQRLGQQRAELAATEARLREFYERNRSWEQSAQLRLLQGSLAREVDLQQQVYLTLAREYETARIEEVNDTPVLTQLEIAVPPSRKSAPRTGLFIVIGFLVGVAGGILAAWALDLRQQQRSLAASRAGSG